MSRFEVGMKIIALADHHQGAFKKGDIFIVRSISRSTCSCGRERLDVGVILTTTVLVCAICGSNVTCGNIWWFLSSRFAPLEGGEFKQVTYTKIIEELPVGAN